MPDLHQNIRAILSQDGDANQKLSKTMQAIRDYDKRFFWVGIYFLKGDELFLGPFSGPTTDHTRIPIGRGVCGTAVAENQHQLVNDVASLTNYLSCNIYTKAELVVLIRDRDETILGQIDIDGTEKGMFDQDSLKLFEAIAAELSPVAKAALQSQT